MKRWFVFFFIVATLLALSALGAFTGNSAERETGGSLVVSKVVMLSALCFAALSYVSWLVYTTRKSREPRRMYGPGVHPGQHPYHEGEPEEEAPSTR